MVKRALFCLLFLLGVGVSAYSYTVVIDAGHGGRDAGAVGRRGLLEKDLNLDISIRLASKIRTQFPDIKVLLTRSTDEFIPLQGRADFVNKNAADLFICVHTNAAESRNARGTEVFILGTDKMDQNLDVAMRENAVIKLESDYKTTYQGFDPNSVESYIMFELMQNKYIDHSLHFASLVQEQFTKTLHREDRGVRQAAFWVLLKSACPSVLVEVGFISNADEEEYLKSDQGKREIADALFSAFCGYYQPLSQSKSVDDDKATAIDSTQTKVNKPKEEKTRGDRSKNNDKKEEAVKEQPKQQPKQEEVVVVKDTVPAAPASCWKVQIFASRTELPMTDPNFKGEKNCTYRLVDGLYKYMVGDCATREEAAALKNQLKAKFPDCFIVEIK